MLQNGIKNNELTNYLKSTVESASAGEQASELTNSSEQTVESASAGEQASELTNGSEQSGESIDNAELDEELLKKMKIQLLMMADVVNKAEIDYKKSATDLIRVIDKTLQNK